jgi:putative membrane protein (TIGR04086 family)
MERTKKTKIVTEDKYSQLIALGTGLAVAYGITCIVFIAYAIIITYTSVSADGMPLVVTMTSIIAALVAGYDAAKGALRRGWLWGLAAGFLYALILIVIGYWIGQGFTFDLRTITTLLLAIAGGGLGGVIGINFRRK